jgi:hypothetical protein
VDPVSVVEQEARAMSQDVQSPRDRAAEPPGANDTQRLREIRERLKRLERELSKMPPRRVAAR